MSEKRIEELIIRFIEGNCSDEGMRELLNWVRESTENRDFLFGMKDIYDRSCYSAGLTEEQIDAGWERLAAECGIADIPVAPQDHIRRTAPRRNPFSRLWPIASAAAACILVLLCGVWILSSKGSVERITVRNDSDKQSHLILPDGSGVWLYCGAEISYPEEFRDNLRDVELDGEAYFDVVRDETSPFIVTSDLLEVEVLGTRFNVESDGTSAQVVLESGSVNLGRIEDGRVVRKVLLHPGELGRVECGDDRITVEEVDVQLYTSWKDIYLNVKSQRFEDVMTMLAKRYNTSIRIADRKLCDERFSGRFSQEQTLEEIFDIINRMIPIRYNQTDDGWVVRSVKP